MVRAGPLHGQGRGFESLTAHQPSLSGAELRLGEPNPKGKAVAPKRNARRRTKGCRAEAQRAEADKEKGACSGRVSLCLHAVRHCDT